MAHDAVIADHRVLSFVKDGARPLGGRSGSGQDDDSNDWQAIAKARLKHDALPPCLREKTRLPEHIIRSYLPPLSIPHSGRRAQPRWPTIEADRAEEEPLRPLARSHPCRR
jgi:hypothetical protein